MGMVMIVRVVVVMRMVVVMSMVVVMRMVVTLIGIMTGLIPVVLSGPGDLHLAPRASASTSIAHNNINLFNQQ
jgi:hypothetical protein